MLTVTCEKCQKRYKIDPRLAGKTLKCKVCQHTLVVPAAEPLESDDLMAGLASASQAETRSQAAPAPARARSSSKAKPAARPAPAAPACPQCSAVLTPGAVLCVSCGYSLATGKKLTTTMAREPASLRRVTTSGNVSRAGSRLVASDASTLPERCVVCNSEEQVTMINKNFSYIPYWAIFLTGYIIGYFLFRRQSSMTYGMCAKHGKLRSIMMLVAGAALLGAIGLLYYSSQIMNTDDRQTCLIAGLVGIPVAVVIALMIPGPRVAHIDGGGVAVYRGCGKKFLESL